MNESQTTAATAATRRIREVLHQVVLMRETGPKSAAWQRARVQTIWRLHALLEASQSLPADPELPPPDAPPANSAQDRTG